MSFVSAVKKLIDYGLAGGIKKMLLGAGIGLTTTAISLSVINYYIDKLINSINQLGDFAGLGGALLALFGLARLDVALSVVISAYVLRFTIKKSQLILTKRG